MNDVTRGYDPAGRRTGEFFGRHHVQSSPPVSAGFSHRPTQHAGVSDRCPVSRGPWLDDYWPYSSAPSDKSRLRYHVTMTSPADVTDLVVKEERLTPVPCGMVTYAGESSIVW